MGIYNNYGHFSSKIEQKYPGFNLMYNKYNPVIYSLVYQQITW